MVGTKESGLRDEDHDDAGMPDTARTMQTAINFASLGRHQRVYAEARCRCVFGLSMLSAGTPGCFSSVKKSRSESPLRTTIPRVSR